jgi:EAL domain-containing protein (putative c-di-GMP-specific phosphodiesterase class I)
VNTLKIDRSFVEQLGAEGSDGAIVAGVVAMAHALGMDVVAEGVETGEQLRKVMDMDCDNAQGFFFARPLTSEVMGRLLADHLSVAVGAPPAL